MSDAQRKGLVDGLGRLTTKGRMAIRESEENAVADAIGRHEFVFDNALQFCFSCGKPSEHPVHESERADRGTTETGDAE